MKKFFLNFSRFKIISKEKFDTEVFFEKLRTKLNAENFNINKNELELKTKIYFLPVVFPVKISVRGRKIKYEFSAENIVILLFALVLTGALFYKGGFESYFFWSSVFFAGLFSLWRFSAKNLLEKAIKESLPKPKKPSPTLSGFVATKQNFCPACGKFLSGFEPICPECGINLGLKNCNSTSYSNFTLKYFLSS